MFSVQDLGQLKRIICAALRLEKGVIAKQGPGVGKAAIGGPFKLLNQDGKVVTDRDFLGNWNLLYFGFTYCPDICPDELTKLAAAVDKIGSSSISSNILHIIEPPERELILKSLSLLVKVAACFNLLHRIECLSVIH